MLQIVTFTKRFAPEAITFLVAKGAIIGLPGKTAVNIGHAAFYHCSSLTNIAEKIDPFLQICVCSAPLIDCRGIQMRDHRPSHTQPSVLTFHGSHHEPPLATLRLIQHHDLPPRNPG
jgi:hypothetical protein